MHEIWHLERRLTQQAAVGLGLSEDNKRLRDQAVEAETKISHLDGELTAGREKLVFLEGDNRSSQKSLDQALAETARLSQRLSDSETALVTAKAHLLKVETALAEVEIAHDRLTVDLKETSERYHAVSKLRFALRRSRPAEEAVEPAHGPDETALDRGAHAA
jgi:crescentin